jgi:transcriptional regulator with XRE-family HTH domain
VDPIRIGADVRLLRKRKRWTQARLATEASVSRWVVSQIECGRADRFTLDVVKRVVDATGGYLSVRIQFHGEGMDRLRDRAHARMVEDVVSLLVAFGWVVETEVSFNHFGERGSIDILAFHARAGTLLIIEVKTVVPDVGGMLMTLDRKVRLAPGLAQARGWTARSVSRLLVLPEASTPRRRVADHAVTFGTSFPARNEAIRRWLRRPTEPIRGLFFLSSGAIASTRSSRAPWTATNASSEVDVPITRRTRQACDRNQTARDGQGSI